MDLDGPGPGLGDGPGVHIGVDVRLHDADPVFLLQHLNGPGQGRGLAGSRRRHEVEQEDPPALQFLSQSVCLLVVVRKDTFLYFDYLDFLLIHSDPPSDP